MSSLNARIFGVRQADMNSVTTLLYQPRVLIKNTIEVYAIDDPAITLIFAGNIITAWGDYEAMPHVALTIRAQAAFFHGIETTQPLSFKGRIDVASAMAQCARKMSLGFENNGVSIQMENLYIANTLLEQVRDLAEMAGIDFVIDDKTLAIMPRGFPRSSLIPLLSKDSGMIGYPNFDGVGIWVRTLFNPGIVFQGKVNVESDVTRAAGEWVVSTLNHVLSSEFPGGPWHSEIRGIRSGLAITR